MSGDLESMAVALEASGDYRVLRRLGPRLPLVVPEGTETRLGIVIDLETTGLDSKTNEIIELGMIPFTFAEGRIYTIGEPYHRLRQPKTPIPPEITAITGLDDAAVAGHAIDPKEVAAFIDSAAVVIAHHAGFDRPFVERLVPAFKAKCWACSMSEIDWHAEGIESTKLAWLLSEYGLFYERHRSIADCHALIALLDRPLPKSGTPALARLLEVAREPTWRIWASASPFESKDILKARGYRWSAGDSIWPKSWYIDIGTAEKEAEITFLRKKIYRDPHLNFRIDKFTAYDRFSEGATP